MKNILLIYSGGLDSTSALYQYKKQIGLAISFNYGSKHNKREIKCAKLNCKKLGIKHSVINLEQVFTHIDSALLNNNEEIPYGHYAEDNMGSTVVPFRNGIMIAIATGIAESKGLSSVMLASHAGDNLQYPDCTPEFNAVLKAAMSLGTEQKVSLKAPFEYMDKRAIAELGIKKGMDPALTYSCYEGDEKHCGKCGTCIERIWALKGFKDNTVYKELKYAIDILKEKGEWNEN